ncbi:MAG: stalk domain-containing protein [Thermoanaerobacteraceae bacterium]|nr:stalk domain-containing protein [Thermoanaerobacteraceae bacterium]
MPLFIKRKKIEFGVPSRIVDGRTLVLLRKFAKSLGCAVEWDPVDRQVVYSREQRL